MTAACAVCRLPMLSESEGKAVLERQWLSQSQIDWLRDFSSIFVMSAGIKTPYDHTGGMFMSKTGSGMVATLTSLEENGRSMFLARDLCIALMQQVFAVKPGAALFESALVPWFCGLGRNAKIDDINYVYKKFDMDAFWTSLPIGQMIPAKLNWNCLRLGRKYFERPDELPAFDVSPMSQEDQTRILTGSTVQSSRLAELLESPIIMPLVLMSLGRAGAAQSLINFGLSCKLALVGLSMFGQPAFKEVCVMCQAVQVCRSLQTGSYAEISGSYSAFRLAGSDASVAGADLDSPAHGNWMQYNAKLYRQPNLAARQRIMVICSRIKKLKQREMDAARAKDGNEAFRKSQEEFLGYYKYSLKLADITSRIGQPGAKEDLTEIFRELAADMRGM